MGEFVKSGTLGNKSRVVFEICVRLLCGCSHGIKLKYVLEKMSGSLFPSDCHILFLIMASCVWIVCISKDRDVVAEMVGTVKVETTREIERDVLQLLTT